MERYKESISLKEFSNVAPFNIFDNCRSLTEVQEITNAFNKYFVKLILLTFTLLLDNIKKKIS